MYFNVFLFFEGFVYLFWFKFRKMIICMFKIFFFNILYCVRGFFSIVVLYRFLYSFLLIIDVRKKGEEEE